MYGPPGAGKSSLINTFSRVVHDETDYNPVAAVNDDERARAIRTYYTKNYPLGRGNLANGRIELWDCRGHWHVGAPQKGAVNYMAHSNLTLRLRSYPQIQTRIGRAGCHPRTRLSVASTPSIPR